MHVDASLDGKVYHCDIRLEMAYAVLAHDVRDELVAELLHGMMRLAHALELAYALALVHDELVAETHVERLVDVELVHGLEQLVNEELEAESDEPEVEVDELEPG